MDERTIKVNGQKRISIPPDIIRINMALITVRPTYEEAISAANIALNDLRECLNTVGFSKDEIKTTDFRVNTKYDNVKDENGNYKRVFVGYEVENRLRIEFEQNPVKLARVLNAIATCKANPEFFITYGIKNDSEIKNMLLIGAINDAKEKAEIMAAAAGVRLGKILNIEYGQSSVEAFNGLPVLAKASGPYLDLEPENLQGEANVTVVWRIEG